MKSDYIELFFWFCIFGFHRNIYIYLHSGKNYTYRTLMGFNSFVVFLFFLTNLHDYHSFAQAVQFSGARLSLWLNVLCFNGELSRLLQYFTVETPLEDWAWSNSQNMLFKLWFFKDTNASCWFTITSDGFNCYTNLMLLSVLQNSTACANSACPAGGGGVCVWSPQFRVLGLQWQNPIGLWFIV